MVRLFQSFIHQYLFLTSIFLSSNSGALAWDVTCRFAKEGKTRYWAGELMAGKVEFINGGNANLKITMSALH